MKDRVMELIEKAVKSNDPARLRIIAAALRELGAWDDAQLVMNKVHDIERRMAEVAAR